MTTDEEPIRVGPDAPAGPPAYMLALPGASDVVPVRAPETAQAEGFLRLSSHLLLAARERSQKVLAVTSARPGEGKTTAAMNLAICIGQARGRSGRVLLVDGDLVNRTLTGLLGGDDLRMKIRKTPDILEPTLLRSRFRGVDLLAAPIMDPFTVEDPDVWRQILRVLRPRYTLIIVDCPSYLSTPSGHVLPSCSDGLILVVREGRTPESDIEKLAARHPDGFAGVILNGSRHPEWHAPSPARPVAPNGVGGPPSPSDEAAETAT